MDEHLKRELEKKNSDIHLLISELDQATEWMYPQYSDEALEKQKQSRLKLLGLVSAFKKVYGV